MQSILGSNGQIGREVADELYRNYTRDIQLVSRNPKKIHDTDSIMAANFLDLEETKKAVAGSDIVYFTAGLPMNSDLVEKQFPTMVQNVVAACEASASKLVFFDNTYMYEKSDKLQTETTPFAPKGRKSVVRANVASLILDEMNQGKLTAVICRAPEFYGPDQTNSITNTMIFNNVKQKKRAWVPASQDTLRTLIWTPDASRAMALIGNAEDAYGQTWHLPCAEPLTYRQILQIAQENTQGKIKTSVVPMWIFKLIGKFNPKVSELLELLPRYAVDNNFSSDKFMKRFPDFKITSYESGVTQIIS